MNPMIHQDAFYWITELDILSHVQQTVPEFLLHMKHDAGRYGRGTTQVMTHALKKQTV